MAPISARTAVLAKWAVIPAALIVSGVVVSQASYSAFSATTTDGTTNWAAGTVSLNNTSTETAAGSATFNAGNLKPGDTGSKCITVTPGGSLSSKVKLYAQGYKTNPTVTSSSTSPTTVTQSPLGPNIELVIREGNDCAAAASATPLYTGALDKFGTEKITFASGLGGDTSLAPNSSRAFQIKYTLLNSTPNTAQGGTAEVGFTWEAQTP